MSAVLTRRGNRMHEDTNRVHALLLAWANYEGPLEVTPIDRALQYLTKRELHVIEETYLRTQRMQEMADKLCMSRPTFAAALARARIKIATLLTVWEEHGTKYFVSRDFSV